MPSWREMKRYCDKDGWDMYRETDHYYYRKMFPDGTIKFTKVSKGSGQIGPKLWKEILKRQLCTTQEYFNDLI